MTICSSFTGIENFADLLVWPTSCNYYFWLFPLGVLFLILVLSLYNREKDDKLQSDLISCLGVSSLVTLFLGLIMTLVENTSNIPMLQQDIFLYVLAFTIPLVVIWLFKR